MKRIIALLMVFLFIGASFEASAKTEFVVHYDNGITIDAQVGADVVLQGNCIVTDITLNENYRIDRGYQEGDINRFVNCNYDAILNKITSVPQSREIVLINHTQHLNANKPGTHFQNSNKRQVIKKVPN